MDLLKHLQTYVPIDPTESAHVARVITFLQDTPHPFHRETLEGHLTGSALIVNPSRDRLLLLHHRKLDRWLQPGGHCDGDPDTLAVAIREAHEETGLTSITPADRAIFDVDVHPIPAKGDIPRHWHYDIRYLLVADDQAPLQPSHREAIALQWVSLPQLTQIAPEESFERVVRKLTDA